MLESHILTTNDEVAALADAWHDLYQRVGTHPFADYGPYRVWWDAIAKEKGLTPHIVTGWRDGKLVALLPLVVRNKAGARILFTSGYDVFFGATQLYENSDDLKVLWEAVRQSALYDVAEIKYVKENSITQEIIKTFPLAATTCRNITSMVRFDGQTGEAWYNNALSGQRRSKLRRKEKALDKEAPLNFRLYTDAVPADVVRAAIGHKRAWCVEHGVDSWVVKDDSFLESLIKETAAAGSLRFFCLWHGDKPIGFCFCIAKDKHLMGYLITHNPELSRYSVGFLTGTQTCKWTADNGFETLDFMEGHETFKSTLTNVQEFIETYVFCRSVRGFPVWSALMARKIWECWKSKRKEKNA